ncbi:hypothetical protein A3D14_02665 [Candidatus Saccharibacteria bacterium RIFCSPHIGHO2_02_FULL_47_12]|nr:MAG: hypothetical protein A3D14_02665 [Candidatus Saccharibacteria bacterium RIFCSPHIGHO2_02_FULL_47_12]
MPGKNDTQNNNGGAQAPIILIDNNMIQHFLSKHLGKELEPILKEVEDIGAVLSVSQIVVYEALKAIVFKPTRFAEVSGFFEKYIVRYPVNEEVLIEAARVHEVYGSDKHTKAHRDSFSSEDVIIGTTAMMLGAFVMTCDANDFPIPFFKEVNRQHIYYQEKGRRRHIVMYLLQPDGEAIGAALEQLNTSNMKPKPSSKKK